MAHTNINNKYIRYLKNPLLNISGFSAYRLPNSLVHLPVIIMVPYLGICICVTEATFLLPVYFIIALYLGRDLVFMSYNNFLIPLCVWSVFVLFFIYITEISHYLTFHSLQRSIAVTVAIVFGFLLYITLFMKYVLKW